MTKIGRLVCGLFLIASMIGGTVAPTFVHANGVEIPAVVQLTDIKGHWAEASIHASVKAGYVAGYQDGTFKPDKTITKAEFIKMLVVALELDIKEHTSPWYTTYVDTAREAGIYTDDFKDTWGKALSRKEMALLSVRAGITGFNRDYDLNRNLYEATKAGILQGTAPGKVDPDGVTTRAQAITVIERVLSVKAGKSLKVDKYAAGAAEILWHNTNIETMLPRYFSDVVQPFNNSMMQNQHVGEDVHYSSDLIVVDLTDKNDPNRKYITKDLVWVHEDTNKWEKLEGVNAFALLTVTKVKIGKDTKETYLSMPAVAVRNADWQQIFEDPKKFDAKNPKSYYPIKPWDKETNSGNNVIVAKWNLGKEITFVRGQTIPKGNFTSSHPYYLIWSPMNSLKRTYMYETKLDSRYNQ